MKKESQGKYTFVIAPDHPMADKRGRVLEHRYKMAMFIGRSLTVKEVVHHKNGDTKDNRIENLELMARGAHTEKHRPANLLSLRCPRCDKEFVRAKRNARGERTFCSRSCSVGFYSSRKGKSS